MAVQSMARQCSRRSTPGAGRRREAVRPQDLYDLGLLERVEKSLRQRLLRGRSDDDGSLIERRMKRFRNFHVRTDTLEGGRQRERQGEQPDACIPRLRELRRLRDVLAEDELRPHAIVQALVAK